MIVCFFFRLRKSFSLGRNYFDLIRYGCFCRAEVSGIGGPGSRLRPCGVLGIASYRWADGIGPLQPPVPAVAVPSVGFAADRTGESNVMTV